MSANSHHRLGYKPRYKKRAGARRRNADEASRFGTFDPPARGNEAATVHVSLAQMAYALGDTEYFKRRSRERSGRAPEPMTWQMQTTRTGGTR